VFDSDGWSSTDGEGGQAVVPTVLTSLAALKVSQVDEKRNLDLPGQAERSGDILDAIGAGLLHLGYVEEAKTFIDAGLEVRRRFYGEDHPEVAESLTTRARFLRMAGNPVGAEQEIQRAIAINTCAFGDDTLPIAVNLTELAPIQIQLSQYASAEQSAQRGLDILSKRRLTRDPNYTRLLDSLARVRRVRGDYDRAAEIYDEALAIDRSQVGTASLKYAMHLGNFGTVLFARGAPGDLDLAEKALRGAIAIYDERVRVPHHPDLIDHRSNFASLLRAQGKFTEARAVLQKLVTAGEMLRGPTHPYVGNDYARLGRACYDDHDLPAAEAAFEKAIGVFSAAVTEGALPEQHAFIAEAYAWQARVLCQRHGETQAARALNLAEKALVMLKPEFGERSVEVAITSAVVGRALTLSRTDLPRARSLLETSLPIVVAVRGEGSVIAGLIRDWIRAVPAGSGTTQNC